jgi:hypothetical protein
VRAGALVHWGVQVRAFLRVALLTQHETRMRHIVMSFVAPLAPPHFLLYLTNGTILGKKSLNIKHVF